MSSDYNLNAVSMSQSQSDPQPQPVPRSNEPIHGQQEPPNKDTTTPKIHAQQHAAVQSDAIPRTTPSFSREDELDELQRQKQHKVKTHQTLLSTQSPQGIAAASAITPNRLAQLLIQTGPLPIRHITKHLSQQIPDFALLSLSKQRRLIMAALEMGDEETGCVFEKVGWGQWATKKISSAEIIEYNHNKAKQLQQQQQQQQQQAGNSPRVTSLSSSPPLRRQSITNPATDPHSLKMPYNPPSLEEAVIESSSSLNSSDSVDDDDEDDEDGEELYDDDELFKMEHSNSSQPNVRFSSRVLNSLNQQQQQTPTQRRSFSAVQQQLGQNQQRRNSSSAHGIRKPRTKSRLNSFDYYEAKFDGQTIDGVLDAAPMPDSIFIRKKLRSSFSESYVRSTPTPNLKISSDESLPLSNSSPPPLVLTQQENDSVVKLEDKLPEPQPDTDEEDWQSIGADKLSAAYTLLMIKKKD